MENEEQKPKENHNQENMQESSSENQTQNAASENPDETSSVESNESSETNDFQNRVPLQELKDRFEELKNNLKEIIIGQDEFLEQLIVGLLADGHVLIEGVPGIAKTLTARLFAKSIKTDFNRIQFTPDLMPSDVLGTSIYNEQKQNFEFKKGPIFSNIVLIDEINRAPAKTQAALFEVMEEKQVSMDSQVYTYPKKGLLLNKKSIDDLGGAFGWFDNILLL